MGFLIAIIGRFGVGKSLLCKHFSDNNVDVINIQDSLLEKLQQYPEYALCCACLRGEYEEITEKIPMVSDAEIINMIIETISQQKSDQQYSVVVLPSFLELTEILKNNIIENIVAVDCSRAQQKSRFLEKGLTEQTISCLLESGYDRPYYRELGSDVFLNSVSMDHMAWVAKQILRAYKLVNSCK